jgi:hypothetical protein
MASRTRTGVTGAFCGPAATYPARPREGHSASLVRVRQGISPALSALGELKAPVRGLVNDGTCRRSTPRPQSAGKPQFRHKTWKYTSRAAWAGGLETGPLALATEWERLAEPFDPDAHPLYSRDAMTAVRRAAEPRFLGRALQLSVPAGPISAAQQATIQSAITYGWSVDVAVSVGPFLKVWVQI